MKIPPLRPAIRSLFLISLSLVTLLPRPAHAANRPNIVYIVADDMGYADCRVQGCTDVPTPNLDALANGGARFTNGYVTGTVCSPSRAALMTGRYHYRDGVKDWIPPGKPGLNTDVPTIADYLQKAGYQTGHVGKWHLGEDDACHPLKRGFHLFFGFLGGGRSYFPDKIEAATQRVNRYTQIVRGTEPVAETEYLTAAFAREAVAFIKTKRDQPFFLYLAFNAVHTPMQPPTGEDRFSAIADPKRRAYAGMLSAMDDGIGRVASAIRESGVENDTLICFISDNGGPITRNAPNASKNTPLRGGKGETWEGGIRVPFFVKWSGHIPAGKVVHEPVIQMDLTASALTLAGATPDAKWPIDGKNILPLLEGKSVSVHDQLCWSYEHQWAIRQGPWKLTVAGAKKDARPSLYNLDSDPLEETDLSSKEPARVEKMRASWEKWRKETVPSATQG
jgi:arylsulfatase A-like enzyme